MKYNCTDTAVVVIDPQNDVLSPTGRNWDVLGASVIENRTAENLADARRTGRPQMRSAIS